MMVTRGAECASSLSLGLVLSVIVGLGDASVGTPVGMSVITCDETDCREPSHLHVAVSYSHVGPVVVMEHGEKSATVIDSTDPTGFVTESVVKDVSEDSGTTDEGLDDQLRTKLTRCVGFGLRLIVGCLAVI